VWVQDFISVVTSIAEDLPAAMRKEMMAFVKRELLTQNWMRALSLKDISLLHPSVNSDRKDHGPLGAYDGWPGARFLALFVACFVRFRGSFFDGMWGWYR